MHTTTDVCLAVSKPATLDGGVVAGSPTFVSACRPITNADIKVWMGDYLEFVKKSGRSWRTIERYMEFLMSYLVFLEGRDPTYDINAGFEQHLDIRYNRSQTVSRTIACVMHFGSWLERTRRISYEQNCFPTKIPYRVPRPKSTITHTQYEALKVAAAGSCFYYMIVMCYNLGIRLGGACMLRWSDVNLEDREIKTIDYKSRAKGIVTRYAWEPRSDVDRMLVSLSSAVTQDQEFVYPYWAIKYQDAANKCSENISRWFREHGVVIGLHNLRHTALSNYANSGTDLMTLSMISGHTNPITLKKYIKPDLEVLRRAATRMLEYAQQGSQRISIGNSSR